MGMVLGAALGQPPPPCWCCRAFGTRTGRCCQGRLVEVSLRSRVLLPPLGISAVPPPSKSWGDCCGM